MTAALLLARRLASRISGRPPRTWDIAAAADVTDTAAPGRYLVNVTAGIGDVLMSLPMIRILRECRPASRIVAIASPITAPLLRREPSLDGTLTLDKPQLGAIIRLARQLRRQRFDVAICGVPSNLLSISLLMRLSGIPRRIKHQAPRADEAHDWQFWFTDLVAFVPERHKVRANIDLLKPLGIEGHLYRAEDLEQRLRLEVHADDLRDMHRRYPRPAQARLRVGLHPGCRPGWEFKRWHPARFAALADRLAAGLGAQTVWFGDAAEVELVRSITAQMATPSLSLAGELTLCELAAMIATCDLVVSNDSGPMHLAEAVGVPTIALFSSADPRNLPARTGPFGRRHRIVSKPDLQDIGVDEVMAAVTQLASQSGRPRSGRRCGPD